MTLLGSEQAGIGSIPTAAGPDSPGINPPVTIPTLAEVYLAGAGDVQADDVFAMPSGNLRFVGSTAANAVPGVAFYESAATPGDSRFATWYSRRFMQVGAHTGRAVFGAMVGYDPNWDGSFSALDGISFPQSVVGYTNADDQTSAGMQLEIGESRFRSFSGFGVGPITYPATGGGSVENFEISLYNSAYGQVYDGHYLQGWGQYINRPLAQSHGITAIIDSRPDFRLMSPEADDGAGFLIRHLDDGTPRAMFEAHMLAADAAGAYGLGFWAYDGSALGKIATFDWTNGIKFFAPLTTSGGGAVPSVFQTVVTVDFTVANQFVDLNTPLVSGKHFVVMAARLALFTRDAALTTAPVVSLAQNGVDLNTPTALSPATLNGQPAPSASTILVSANQSPDMTTFPLQLHVGTAAAGAGLTSCTGTYYVSGIYV